MQTELWSFFVIRHIIRERVSLCPELLTLAQAGFGLNSLFDAQAVPRGEGTWGLGICLARMTWSREDERVGVRIFENATYLVAKGITAVHIGMLINRYPTFYREKPGPE